MTPWQWQDKINYEIMIMKSSLERIVALDAASYGEKKSFAGYIHVSHSHILACIKNLENASTIAYSDMVNQQGNE